MKKIIKVLIVFILGFVLVGCDDYSPSYYIWKTYSGGVIPGERVKSKFPWVLYARKLRNR